MSNGEHEIRTPKGLRIGNRSVVDGKNMLQIKRGGCEDYISAESLVECTQSMGKSEKCTLSGFVHTPPRSSKTPLFVIPFDQNS